MRSPRIRSDDIGNGFSLTQVHFPVQKGTLCEFSRSRHTYPTVNKASDNLTQDVS